MKKEFLVYASIALVSGMVASVTSVPAFAGTDAKIPANCQSAEGQRKYCCFGTEKVDGGGESGDCETKQGEKKKRCLDKNKKWQEGEPDAKGKCKTTTTTKTKDSTIDSLIQDLDFGVIDLR